MNLKTKKELAARTLKIGKERIQFVQARLDDIKEAITKEDMRHLVDSGAILIKPVKGRKTNVSRKNKRGTGKVKKKVNKRKQEYVVITRKLRKYVQNQKISGLLSREEVKEIRKRIRNRAFKSRANLKLYIEGLRK
jgi:large subunit ribosomal protein L19e